MEEEGEDEEMEECSAGSVNDSARLKTESSTRTEHSFIVQICSRFFRVLIARGGG